MENIKKILYDKVNKRIANIQWFIDQNGDCWIDTDPYGMQMSSLVTIKFLKKDHPQYEVRRVTLKELDKQLNS